MRPKLLLSALAIVGGMLLVAAQPGAPDSKDATKGGVFRIVFNTNSGLDYVDPALASSAPGWAVLDTTCAHLMTYPDKPAPPFNVVPEVATGPPRVSHNRKTYTFTLRTDFKFSNGAPVRPSAFVRAIYRTLAPGVNSPGAQHTLDIVGAADVLAGRKRTIRGISVHGNKLSIRFVRPAPDFVHRTTTTFLCAVPPNLPSDPEGVLRFPAAGPYYVADYVPGERVVLRLNPYYHGERPHHVAGFDINLAAQTPQDVVRFVDRGQADWGYVPSGIYFDRTLGIVAKYGINRKRFFVRPGFTLRMLAFNSARHVFENNPSLRKAVNYALNRQAIINGAGGPQASVASDQYLPPAMPGFKDASIYPLDHANLARAQELPAGTCAAGRSSCTRATHPSRWPSGGSSNSSSLNRPRCRSPGFPLHTASGAYYKKLGSKGEPWDLALALWQPSYVDPYAYLNQLLDGRYAGGTNFTRFDSQRYNRQMRRTANFLPLGGRIRAYGALDVRLAREAAPIAPVDFLKEPTLVSSRVGCIVLRPVLDLTAVCLK